MVVLGLGCDHFKSGDETEVLQLQMKQVRAEVKRWDETVKRLETSLAAQQKTMDKINADLASRKEDVNGLKEEWRDLRIGELAGWKADLQATQRKCDIIADDLVKMKKGLNVVTAQLNGTEKEAADGKL
jgi:chromosome segregation ATPase